ncbi:MAG: helix-turn-helix domain-containing protein [Frankiales bacterium]|nr:MAG: helix-turn-helix domain-containing protein [Frankiales bacterium]
MSDVVTTLGAALRAAREAAGLSLEQVSAQTRVRVQLLRDLEQDRVDTCGGAVYARGHVRAAAHAVGVDPAPLVALFDRQSGTAPPEHVDVKPVPLPRAPTRSLHVPLPAPPERRTPRWAQAAIATLAVLVGLFVVGETVGEPATPDREPVAGQASLPIPSSAPVAAAPEPAAMPAPKPRPSGAVLGLRIADGWSWISVRAAGTVVFEDTVRAGWARTFTHPEQVQVRVGNAGAVRVSCAGGMGAPAGAVGAVLTLSCGPGGLARP